MKKILALSLTLALASTFGICGTLASDEQTTLRQEIDKLHASANDLNDIGCCSSLLFDNGMALNKVNNGYTIAPSSTQNSTQADETDNQKSATGNEVNRNDPNSARNLANSNRNTATANDTTNNIATTTQGTSPYGIGQANSGVLPNNANNARNNANAVQPRNTNLDSMVRTNNIDTYKNNINTNLDGRIYNNDGAMVGTNTQGVDTMNNINNGRNAVNGVNYGAIQNGVNSQTTSKVTANDGISPRTNNAPRQTTLNTTTPTPSTTFATQNINDATSDRINTQNNVANQTSTSKGYATEKATTTESVMNNTNRTTTATPRTTKIFTTSVDSGETQNSTNANYTEIQGRIDELNNRLSSLNATMDESLTLARTNIERVINKEITLNDTQASQINSYSRLLRKITHKLTENEFELMQSAGEIALAQSNQNKATDLSAVYLDMQYTLTCREHCINCANDALNAINSIFENFADQDASTTTQDTTNDTTTDTNVTANNTTATTNRTDLNTSNTNTYNKINTTASPTPSKTTNTGATTYTNTPQNSTVANATNISNANRGSNANVRYNENTTATSPATAPTTFNSTTPTTATKSTVKPANVNSANTQTTAKSSTSPTNIDSTVAKDSAVNF